MFRTPALRDLALWILLMTFASTILYFVQSHLVGEAITDRALRRAFLARIDLAGTPMWVSDRGLQWGQTVRLRLLARDISIVMAEPTQTSIQNHWPVQIVEVSDLDHPSQRLLRLHHPAGPLLARITHRAWEQLGLQVGQSVWAQVKSVAVVRH